MGECSQGTDNKEKESVRGRVERKGSDEGWREGRRDMGDIVDKK